MNYTLLDLLGATAAALTFSLFLLSPGYLFALWLDVAGMRRKGPYEQALWAVALSLPIALLISSVLGRYVSTSTILAIFTILDAIALARLLVVLRRSPIRFGMDRGTRTLLLCLASFAAYLLIATTSIQVGPRLFEGVNAADWSVRLPLVDSAIRNDIPPSNPLFTAAGTPQPMRYYYFWYVLCAQAGRLTGLPARACLSGSILWSAAGLISALFLFVRYLCGDKNSKIRRLYLTTLALCCVMGFDVIPTIARLFAHPHEFTPEIEWWRDDRVPSFIGAIVFAPHHIAGVVCGAIGFLVLASANRSARSEPGGSSAPLRLYAVSALTSGICFAAMSGTSTYVALCFVFICAAYGINLILERRWLAVAALILGGTIAVLLARPFLHEMLSGPALASHEAGHQYLKFAIRNLKDGRRVVGFISVRLSHQKILHGWKSYVPGAFIAMLWTLFEIGFFLFPLMIRIKRDLRRLRVGEIFPPEQRALWACFLGICIPTLFLSSEPTQGINDLGRHAGLVVRFLLIVWSVPLVDEFLQRRRQGKPIWPGHPMLLRLAVASLAIGVVTQAWQVVVDRTYLMMAQIDRFNPEMPFIRDTTFGERYFDMRRGFEAVAPVLPPDAIVQANPGSRFEPIVMLYANRVMAAGDNGCEAAFGGDPELCKPIIRDLQKLYGGPADHQFVPYGPFLTQFTPDFEDQTTVATFDQVCRDEKLSMVIAHDSDPAWSSPRSWVWQKPLYATPRVRFLPCPSLRSAKADLL